MSDSERLILQTTADGSLTFFSSAFGEAFHSQYGARQEAEGKFVLPTQLASLAIFPHLSILDICYGLGYNSTAALETIWAVNPNCQVQLIGLENDLEVPKAAIAQGCLKEWSAPIQKIAQTLAEVGEDKSDLLSAQLIIGDARQTIQQVYQQGWQADAIFLDPFSPPRCPQLWTVEFLGWVSRCLAPTGRLATYSCSAAIRTALQQAGLAIGATAPIGRRSPGTVASFDSTNLPPLSQQEQEHLQTRAAIPYRDPDLESSTSEILQHRQQEQQSSNLESSSSWKQRWLDSSQHSEPN
jgi:tRNA U34 5-methylaminomethyl-2-thiouridine-forming methyltransferase MnmC